MSGWVPFDAKGWPELAEFLTSTGRPWPDAAAGFDLRYTVDQGERIPGRPALAARWNWSDRRVRAFLAEPSRWWDPLRGEAPTSRNALRSVGVQLPSSPRPAGVQSENVAPVTIPPIRPVGVQPVSSPCPAGVHTRVDPPSPSPSPSPPAEQGAPPALVLVPNEPPGKTTRKPKKPPANGHDGAWIRSLSDLWNEAWNPDTRGRYAFQLQGKDRHLLAAIADAAGIERNVAPTDEQRAYLRAAFDRYLAAADRGEAWPQEPPTIGGFALKVAAWLQPAGLVRSRDGPRRGQATAEEVRSGLDALRNYAMEDDDGDEEGTGDGVRAHLVDDEPPGPRGPARWSGR